MHPLCLLFPIVQLTRHSSNTLSSSNYLNPSICFWYMLTVFHLFKNGRDLRKYFLAEFSIIERCSKYVSFLKSVLSNRNESSMPPCLSEILPVSLATEIYIRNEKRSREYTFRIHDVVHLRFARI